MWIAWWRRWRSAKLLLLPRFVEQATLCQKFGNGSVFDDTPCFEHHDVVGPLNGGETVGNHQSGGILQGVVDSLLNELFGDGVKAAGGFVE